MHRRNFFARLLGGQDYDIVGAWRLLNEDMEAWGKEWNAMVKDAGTRSVGEQKAWDRLAYSFKQLGEIRKRLLA